MADPDRGRGPITPELFRDIISVVLTVGVLTSAALVALGFLAALVVGWGGSLTGAGPAPLRPTDFGTVRSGLAALRPVAIAQLGLLVLLATPVLRVVASVIAFALEEDGLYVAITLGVLAILLGSIFFIR